LIAKMSCAGTSPKHNILQNCTAIQRLHHIPAALPPPAHAGAANGLRSRINLLHNDKQPLPGRPARSPARLRFRRPMVRQNLYPRMPFSGSPSNRTPAANGA